MTSATTTGTVGHLRATHDRRSGRAARALQRILAAVAVGFITLVVLPGTASAWTEPFVPAVPAAGGPDTVPAPVVPESSGWTPTTIVAIVAVAALIAVIAYLAERTAHRRHGAHGTALPG